MKNESIFDRVIRVIISIALFAVAYFFLLGALAVLFYVIGFVVLITVITGFCGFYKLFGINTSKKKKK